MFYRESGQFKTSYTADQAIVPVRQDRYLLLIFAALFFGVFPLTASEFTMQTMLLPFLIYTLAALGLNVLTGYAGQLSLGTAGFMGVGAYACYKMVTLFPEMNLAVAVLLSGVFSALVGVAFGIPSLRIKGFYLAIATLAAQFFLVWLFEKLPWLYNHNASGAIEVPNLDFFGIPLTGATAPTVNKYYFVLGIVAVLTLVAINLVRGKVGREWQAVRDFDIAAELIGLKLLRTKLVAFAVSSYYVGVSGALLVFMWKGAAEPNLFDIGLSFQILFMVIIGGLGSILGAYFGAAFIVILPVFINAVPDFFGFHVDSVTLEHVNLMIIGALIILFLILEPHGLARLWMVIREKLRLWPFPH